MPRIRSIKPDFFKSEDVSALPLRARLTWIGLWTQCDDHGRYKDSARLIKGDLWSLDDVSLRDIDEDLAILAAEQRIVRYQVDGKAYLAVVNWHAHQAINRPGRAKHPAPPKPLGSSDSGAETYCSTGECNRPNSTASPAESSVSPHGALTEHSRNRPASISAGHSTVTTLTDDSLSPHGGLSEGSRQERKGKEGKGGDAREAPPAPDHPGSEPPPRCPEHLDQPTIDPCGPCGTARRQHEAWEHDQAAAAAATRSELAHQRAQAERAAINACPACDTIGRLTGGALCHHDPTNTDRTRQRIAEARAAARPKDAPSEEHP